MTDEQGFWGGRGGFAAPTSTPSQWPPVIPNEVRNLPITEIKKRNDLCNNGKIEEITHSASLHSE